MKKRLRNIIQRFKGLSKKRKIGVICVFAVLITAALIGSMMSGKRKVPLAIQQHCQAAIDNLDETDFNQPVSSYGDETTEALMQGSSGFGYMDMINKSCVDFGYTFDKTALANKEAEEVKKLEKDKNECESSGKEWWSDYIGCLSKDEIKKMEAEQAANSKESTDFSSVDSNNTQKKPASRHKVSEDAAEHYCQDAGLLNRYVDSKKISTIYITNYSKKYDDSFTYDKDGNPIWFLQWNGKVKSTGGAARFSCWISGNNDSNITLHWLSVGGQDLYGQAGFASYDKNGALVK